MEALTAEPVASPALHQLTLNVFGTVDTWAADPARDALARLAEQARAQDVALIPQSIGSVLPLLEATPVRLEIALDAILHFDLYEAASALEVLVWRGHPEAILAAAALIGHPAVSSRFRELVGVQRVSLSERWQQDLFGVRTDPTFQGGSDQARWEQQLRWPPDDPRNARFAFALLDLPSERLTARDHFRLLVDLVSAGAVVRRVPEPLPFESHGMPGWVPRVGPGARRQEFFVKSPVGALARQRLVERIFRLAPKAWRQPRPFAAKERPPLLELSTIQAFDDGAFPRREAAYLAGVRGRGLGGFRRYENLQPLQFRGAYYWSFSQVVGLRVAEYLFRISGRQRGVASVADRLVGLARRHQEVPVGVTQTGAVLVRDGDALYDVETGQLVEEHVISLVDEVYEPFPLEGGMAPRLLRPAPQVAVHPGVVRGLPCVAGTRVTVDAVTKVLAAVRASSHEDPLGHVGQLFGLQEAQIHDAVRVAGEVNAAA